MKVMVLVKATKESEAGQLPSMEELTAMDRFNEELVKAGVVLAGEGLHASAKGVRIYYTGDKRTVVDGPFTEAKELIAGFGMWQVKSMAEAIEWARRAPFPDGQVEIRQVIAPEDFAPNAAPEVSQ